MFTSPLPDVEIPDVSIFDFLFGKTRTDCYRFCGISKLFFCSSRDSEEWVNYGFVWDI